MIRPLRRTLSLLISVSLAIPSAGWAHPSTPATNDFAKQYQSANAYGTQFANLEQTAGPGQVRGSLAPDRFLLMEQTVYRKEVPVVRTFAGHTFRKWGLKALQNKTLRYQSRLGNADEELSVADTVAFAKAMFAMYVKMSWMTEEHPVDREVVAAVANISGASALTEAILPLLGLSKDAVADLASIADPDARLNSVLDVMLNGLIKDHLSHGRRVDTPLFLWDSQKSAGRLKRIETVLNEVQKRWESNERFGLWNKTESPYERKIRNVNWWDTTVQVQNEERTLTTLALRDTAAGVDTSAAQPFFCAEEKCRFNIVKDKTVLHSFGIPTKVVGTFNQFVVFTHPDSYDAETGTQYLLFIDLETYNGLIGNEDLPVFRLPLKIDEPIRSLNVRSGKLVLNDRFFVESGFFEQASEMQQVAFNLQANLLAPDSWAKVLPLVDSVQEYFSKSVRNQLEESAQQRGDLVSAGVLMKQLGTELQAHLNAQKNLKPLVGQERKDLQSIVETPPAQQDAAFEAVKLYHQRVSQSEQLSNIMSKSQAREKISRKLMARVRLLGSALVSPRPFASQKIKEALGSWYVRRGEGGGMMERLLRLTDRPFANAGVIAAGIWGAVAPDSFLTMLNTGFGVGNSVVDYIVFALGGIGEASAAGSAATFAPFYDLGSSVMKQYVEDGALARTAVAIPMFIGFLAGLYFVPHFLFNFAELYRDLKKMREEGTIEKGWRGWVSGIVPRMQKFKEEYFARLAADEGHRRNFGKHVEFTPEETQLIRQWVETRRAEQAKGGIFKRIGNAISNTFDRVTSAVASPFKNLIEASLESQSEDILTAMERADGSSAVQRTVRDSNEDFTAFWAAFKSTGIGNVLGGGIESTLGFAKNYGGAAKDFMISAPAFELSLGRWVKVWNTWAMWRFATFGWAKVRVMNTEIPFMLTVKPVSFTAKLLYPEFQNTMALRRTGQRVIPTEANGGLRSRLGTGWNVMGMGAATQFQDSDLGIDPHVAGDLLATPEDWDPGKQLESLKKFEDKIIDAEQQISEVAFRKSLEALAGFMTNKDDLKTVFNAKGMDNIVAADIKELSWKSQTFVRAHYESVYNAAMEKFLGEELERRQSARVDLGELTAEAEVPEEAAPDVDVTQEQAKLTLQEMKARIAALNISDEGKVQDFSFDTAAARNAALAVAGDPAHGEAARAAVAKGRLSVSNYLMNTKYKLAADYDPTQNPSMGRVEKVHTRLQSPGALSRAVRAERIKLIVTAPIDLAAKLLLTAGIYEGAFKPLQEYFWGPNSVFYLSETSFYMIYASGFFMSMMADAWVKLQTDARQDEMGEFGQIPQGEDAERGFLRWFHKQFMAPENSIMKNWGFSNYVAFWNMPAALANIALFYFMFSGRIDLSLLTAGYIISFATPISAFHYKVENAIERAIHYAARGVLDEKWMAHTEVQKLLMPDMEKLRFNIAVLNDIRATVQGEWLNNIEMIPTSLGTRGLQRSLFGGGLLEEYIINGGLKPLQNAVTGVPVLEKIVKPIAKGCELLLSNGNTDLTKLKK